MTAYPWTMASPPSTLKFIGDSRLIKKKEIVEHKNVMLNNFILKINKQVGDKLTKNINNYSKILKLKTKFPKLGYLDASHFFIVDESEMNSKTLSMERHKIPCNVENNFLKICLIYLLR